MSNFLGSLQFGSSFSYGTKGVVITKICRKNLNEGGDIMFKQSIRFPLIYFVVLTVWQFIANTEVNWIDNIMVCLIMFLIIVLYKWSEIPYKWNKD